MSLLIGGLVAGISNGVIYGLMAFAIVLLYKCTGVINFAQGGMATFAAFVVWKFVGDGSGKFLGVLGALLVSTAVGALIYLVAIRPRGTADRLNLIMRTLAIYLGLLAVINLLWGPGQPFTFPTIVSAGNAITLHGTTVSWLVVITVAIGVCLALVFGFGFRHTRIGLLFLGFADRPDVARLLGVRANRLGLIAWSVAGVIALITGLLVAPTALLTTNMTDPYLLFAFTAVIIGGLNSLTGSLIGGLLIGIIGSIATIYTSSDIATLTIFAAFLVTLVVRPHGLLGSAVEERL